MRTRNVFLSLLSVLAVSQSSAWAQIARGAVVEEASGAPIRGAFVELINEQGQRLGGVLSGENGEFVFLARPGRYQLRAQRIGHRTSSIPAFDLADRQTREFQLRLAVNAFRLPEISVRGEARCSGRPEGNAQTAQVWEEARKALTVAAWVESAMPATFRYRLLERDLDLDLNETGRPQMRFNSTAGTRAFHSASVDSLSEFGYVQDRNGETYLYGPDAELLLSNSFLNQHCFRLTRRADRRGMIGLAFQPINGRRLPDIRGVLWLEEQSGELRFIEFGYTGRELYGDTRYAGGRTTFRQLPNGAWIVQNWYIRAPRLGRAHNTQEIRVLGTHEVGGDVLDAQLSVTGNTTIVARTAVTGLVFDNIISGPLAGARVYLSGTPFSATTNHQGRFRIDSIPVGDYYIAFEHPRLDSLPIYPPAVPFRADSAVIANMVLTLPAGERIIEEVCPPEERLRTLRAARDTSDSNRGLIFGTVHDPEKLFGSVEVGLTWRRAYAVTGASTASLGNIAMRPHSIAASVDDNGQYFICGVPIDHPVVIDLSIRQRVVRRDSVRLMPPGLIRRDFTVPRR
jgi:hypothetical protein